MPLSIQQLRHDANQVHPRARVPTLLNLHLWHDIRLWPWLIRVLLDSRPLRTSFASICLNSAAHSESLSPSLDLRLHASEQRCQFFKGDGDDSTAIELAPQSMAPCVLRQCAPCLSEVCLVGIA